MGNQPHGSSTRAYKVIAISHRDKRSKHTPIEHLFKRSTMEPRVTVMEIDPVGIKAIPKTVPLKSGAVDGDSEMSQRNGIGCTRLRLRGADFSVQTESQNPLAICRLPLHF